MAARGTIRMALASAALFAALTTVVWRQSRALEVLRVLDETRQTRALAEAERARLLHEVERLESRPRVLAAAAQRLDLRVPVAAEIVIVRDTTEVLP